LLFKSNDEVADYDENRASLERQPSCEPPKLNNDRPHSENESFGCDNGRKSLTQDDYKTTTLDLRDSDREEKSSSPQKEDQSLLSPTLSGKKRDREAASLDVWLPEKKHPRRMDITSSAEILQTVCEEQPNILNDDGNQEFVDYLKLVCSLNKKGLLQENEKKALTKLCFKRDDRIRMAIKACDGDETEMVELFRDLLEL